MPPGPGKRPALANARPWQTPRLPPDALLQMRRIARALHRDAVERAANLGQIVGRQRHAGRADIFLQPVQLGGAGDRAAGRRAARQTVSAPQPGSANR